MDAAEQDAGAALSELLREGAEQGVFPGAVAAVGVLRERGRARVVASAGVLAPSEGRVARGTVYDLASLTKPLVSVAALRLVQRGRLDLSQPVSHVLGELEDTLGGESTLAELLSHRAGLAAWAPLYAEIPGETGADARKLAMLRAAATRADPEPRAGKCVYSDLGYMLVGELLARAAGSSLDVLVEREVTAPLGLASQLFYVASPGRELASLEVAPTELCKLRGRVLRAEVHDENAHALGGIAGHAGMFGTADAVLSFGLSVLEALEGRSTFLDQALLRWALSARGEGYRVGWDAKSAEGSSAGELFSAQSFGHLGYTGTSIWCDPLRRLCAVLLTNRVHPTRENVRIRAFRPRFHDRVIALLPTLV